MTEHTSATLAGPATESDTTESSLYTKYSDEKNLFDEVENLFKYYYVQILCLGKSGEHGSQDPASRQNTNDDVQIISIKLN